jgi:hypothetical protein
LKIYVYLLTSSILKIFLTKKNYLRFQLQHYKLDVLNHPKLKNMSSIVDLCQRLVKIEKLTIYPLINRLIQLILTLPVQQQLLNELFQWWRLLNQDFTIGWRIIFLQIIWLSIYKRNCWKIHNWYDNRWFLFYERMISTIKINI